MNIEELKWKERVRRAIRILKFAMLVIAMGGMLGVYTEHLLKKRVGETEAKIKALEAAVLVLDKANLKQAAELQALKVITLHGKADRDAIFVGQERIRKSVEKAARIPFIKKATRP